MFRALYNTVWDFLYLMASPRHFYRIAGRMIPWLAGLCVLALIYGLYGGLVLAPPDYQQGESFRIIYVHVPSAWMSMFIYTFMAVLSGIHLIWRMKLADIMATALSLIHI